MTIDQRKSHCPRLCHAHQSVIDGAVTVRMQHAHHLTDHAGALHVPLLRFDTHIIHREQDASLDRFQAIAGVRQSTGIDDGIGVFEETGLHLLGDVDVQDVFLELLGGIGHGLVQISSSRINGRSLSARPSPSEARTSGARSGVHSQMSGVSVRVPWAKACSPGVS